MDSGKRIPARPKFQERGLVGMGIFHIVGRRIAGIGIGILSLAAAVLLLWMSPSVTRGVVQGLALCAQSIIPSLFVFMILAVFLSRSAAGRVLSVLFYPITRWVLRLDPQLGSVIAMSFVGGYPVGASLLSDLVRRGEVSQETASRMMCFCCNAGPAFVITAVGVQFFGSAKAGLILLASHMLSSLAIGWALSFRRPAPNPPKRERKEAALGYSQAFVEAVASASSSILMICAYVVLFSAVLVLLSDSGILPGAAAALSTVTGLEESFFTSLLGGLLEVTTGCAALVQAKVGSPLVLASFFLSFSGISIHMQVRHCFRGLQVSLRPFLISRFAGALLSAGLTWGILRLFPESVSAGLYYYYPPVPGMNVRSYCAMACLVILCSLFLISISAGICAISSKLERRRGQKNRGAA